MKRKPRRAQAFLLLLVLTSVSLITVDHRRGMESPLNAARRIAASVFGPIEAAVGGASDAVADAAGRRTTQREDPEASRLRTENAQLRRQLRMAGLERNRVEQLDTLLRVAGTGRYRTVPAEVVAVAPAQSLSRTVTIDAGSRDGIKPDMTVINGDGLVGRVRTVGPWTATVLLAIDRASSVGVRLEASMEIGVATGSGSGSSHALRLQLLDGQAPVGRGDRLVTFGSRGNLPYVPGVPVGSVAAVSRTPTALTREAVVTPYVDFTALGLVGVVVEPPRTNPRDAVLPPRPAASAAPSTPARSAGSTPSASAATRG